MSSQPHHAGVKAWVADHDHDVGPVPSDGAAVEPDFAVSVEHQTCGDVDLAFGGLVVKSTGVPALAVGERPGLVLDGLVAGLAGVGVAK